MLNTVNVPDSFAPIFEKAQHSVQQYFNGLKQEPEQGTIAVEDSRYVLIRGAAFSVEFFQLVRQLFGEENSEEADRFASSLLYELAHAIGRSDAKNFAEKMQLTDPIEKLSAGPVHFSHTGWAFVDILPESNPSADESFCLIYKHPYSFECDAWLDSQESIEHPACVMNAGYSSGWCQESFSIPLEARELTCRSLNHDDCLFLMAQPQVLDEKIAQYLEQNPTLTVDVHQFSFKSFEQQKTSQPSNQWQGLLQQRLFTYARQLEATKEQLSLKLSALNSEIEHRKKIEALLLEREQYWRELIDTSFDAMIVCNNESIIHANKMSTELFSIAEKNGEYKSLQQLFPSSSYRQILLAIEQKEAALSQLHLFDQDENHTDDKYVDIHFHYTQNKDNEPVVILAIRDITERALATQRLERLANFDALTGLPNRTRFQHIINRALMQQDFSKKYALLFLDLDSFKIFNDTLGHSAGDYILYELAQRMTQAIRGGNTICRLGGDEFAVWIPDLSEYTDAENVAQQILTSLERPINVNGEEIIANVSIGIAVFPKDGLDYSTLINHADHAMYQAKALGKARFHCYDPAER